MTRLVHKPSQSSEITTENLHKFQDSKILKTCYLGFLLIIVWNVVNALECLTISLIWYTVIQPECSSRGGVPMRVLGRPCRLCMGHWDPTRALWCPWETRALLTLAVAWVPAAPASCARNSAACCTDTSPAYLSNERNLSTLQNHISVESKLLFLFWNKHVW